MNEESEGFSEWLSQVAIRASQNAIQSCIDAGIPYVVLRGTQILKIYPDGTQQVIKELIK